MKQENDVSLGAVHTHTHTNNFINKKILIIVSLISLLLTFILIIIIYKICSLAPFGDSSLACSDANIQYLDFFMYFKDVLSGENSIFYTLSKGLGGSNIGVFGYYLASPLNLLVAFFDNTQLHTFFDILICIKLSLSAMTFAIFILNRFAKYIKKDKLIIVVLLSISYALCQYCFAQSSNIMWLDGVYMLPLILLGVYNIVEGKSLKLLSISVALSIIFNWYSAGINCLFSIIWFVFESILFIIDNKILNKNVVKDILKKLVKYTLAMVLGILISAILFLPNIVALQSSSRGEIDLSILTDISFTGNIVSVIQGYVLGSTSSYGNVSLFCGGLALLGCISCIISKDIDLKKRILFVIMLVGVIFLFYWKPFFSLFSLLKSASSFYYRYSYVGIITILFLSAYYFLNDKFSIRNLSLIKIALCFSAILCTLNYLNSKLNVKFVYFTCACLIIIACLVTAIFYIRKNKKTIKIFANCILCIFIMIELIYNAKVLVATHSYSDIDEFNTYITGQKTQIEAIESVDDSNYRISQTLTRNMKENNLTANYNEAMAYNYWSISSYTSCPDDLQRTFLENLGYRKNGENMNIINTSILAADSLLGVKYILSKYAINGLTIIDDIDEYNNKYVYENPYCLPMAFVYDNTDLVSNNTSSNPFEYQNELYSQLLGEEVELYIPLSFEIIQEGDISSGNTLIYELELIEGNYAIYGNILWNEEIEATLNINNMYECEYSEWLSPSVFYIPTNSDEEIAILELNSTKSYDLKYGEEQFYALDLDKLKEVTEKLSSREADSIEIQNGYANITVEASLGENLYVSIPYDDNWTIYLNGEEIDAELFAECMYSISLVDGINNIEMIYENQYLTIGAVISVVGIIILIIIICLEKRSILKPFLVNLRK